MVVIGGGVRFRSVAPSNPAAHCRENAPASLRLLPVLILTAVYRVLTLVIVQRRVVPATGMVLWPAIAVPQFVPPHTWHIKPGHVAFAIFDGRASPQTIARPVIN